MLWLIMYAVFLAQSTREAQALTMSTHHLIEVDVLLKTESNEEEGPVQDETVPENSPENNRLVTENDQQRDGMVPENCTESSRLNSESDIQTDGMVPENYTKSSRLVTENAANTDGMVPENYTKSSRLVTENDANTDGMVPENYTDINELTRHMSKKKMKSFYTAQCTGVHVNSKACTSLLSNIVMRQSGTVKKMKKNYVRKRLNKIFLACFNDGAIVIMDPDTQICCNGLFNKTGNEECCNGDIIDSREQFCCNEQVRNRTESSMCCGIYTYDTRTHTCCNGKLYTKLEGSSCCGDFAYDNSTQICCFDTYMFSRSQGDLCCGKAVYNSSTHTCCQTSVQPIHGIKNRKGECCGEKNINIACYKCESDAILPLFNETSHICCERKIRMKKYGNYTGCCRQFLMDTRTKRCHDGMIIDMVINTSSVTDVTAVIEVTGEENGFGKKEDDGFHEEVDTLKAHSTGTIIIIAISVSTAVVAIAAVLFFLCRRRNRRKENDACNIEATSLPPEENEQLLNDRVSNSALNCSNSNPIDVNSTPSEFSTLMSSACYTSKFDSFNNDIASIIEKKNNIPNENIFANHTKDSFTQTGPGKESNRRTIFGKPFDHNFILGMSNGTAIMPNSEVKMTLPASLLKHNQVEVNCQSFRTINQLRKKLGLASDENIASPVVEYALTGYGPLQDYAVVIMPFLGSPSDLKVRKFQSDEGLNTVVESVDVPLQGKTNEDVDAFYIVKDSEVYIYTKSFSGFFCKTCRHRPLRLRCFLFGSYKRFTNPIRYEVRLMMYLADELMRFADYKERMFTNENAEGRVLKKEMQLRLPQELFETDMIEASVVPTESHDSKWIHKLYPGSASPIYDEVQTVKIENVAEKCKNCENCHLPEHDIPTCVEWYLTNANGVIPDYTFQCIVDVDVVREADNTKTSNPIVIDELQLRQEDRCLAEEQFSARSLQGLKEYMSGAMSVEKRDAILSALLSKYRCTGSTVEEVFFRLQDKLKANYILEAVAIVMKEKHLFTELDVLQANGILPMNFISSVQPVCQDSPRVNNHTDEENQDHHGNGHFYMVNPGRHENSPDEVNQNQNGNDHSDEVNRSPHGNDHSDEVNHSPHGNGHNNEINQSPRGNGHSDEDNCAYGQPIYLFNDTTNGSESRKLAKEEEEGINTKETFRLNEIYHKDESQKIARMRPAYTLMNETMVRPELSHTQQVMGMSKSLNDVTLTGASGVLDVRGEITKPAFEEKPSDESLTLHAQECASMDDTHIKRLNRKSECED